MPLETTVIGSMPKPEYLDLVDWFKAGTGGNSSAATKATTKLLAEQTEQEKEEMEQRLMKATEEVIDTQIDCGIAVVTDGEVRRENYIHYLCRFIDGIDFENLTKKSVRNGAYIAELPTIVKKVSWRGPLDVAAEWKKAQGVSKAPVKYTLPGPLTIIGTIANAFYESEEELATDLADIVNLHVRALSDAGCRYIQVDEPLFARQPEKALAYGIKLLDRVFAGTAAGVRKDVHICCGYPEYLDQKGYLKADRSTYFQLAPALDETCIDAVSLEDAHCNNDLTLLREFKKTKVIFGAVKIASSTIESQEEIEERLNEALEHIDADNLIVAPDCGLALLPPPVLEQKLRNMCRAAKNCGCKRSRTEGKSVQSPRLGA